MQQMIAPFRADVQPAGGWRAALPSHRLFADDLADVIPAPKRGRAAQAIREPAPELVASPRRRRPAGVQRLTRSVLMFLERSRCLG
jgi:hypothetical protein